jgi:hypothetical protein
MSKLDSCHWQVVHALEKDGWAVNAKPPLLIDQISAMMVRVDMYAERQTDGRIIVEVKCYPQQNKTQELYISFGQYILYRAFLESQGVTSPLYLAIPKDIYEDTFHHIIQKAIQDNGIKLIIVDIEMEVITEWIG